MLPPARSAPLYHGHAHGGHDGAGPIWLHACPDRTHDLPHVPRIQSRNRINDGCVGSSPSQPAGSARACSLACRGTRSGTAEPGTHPHQPRTSRTGPLLTIHCKPGLFQDRGIGTLPQSRNRLSRPEWTPAASSCVSPGCLLAMKSSSPARRILRALIAARRLPAAVPGSPRRSVSSCAFIPY